MGLPIAVSDVFKIFELATGRKAEQRKRVIEWLDAVYGDLEELSQLWVKIMSDTESENLQESKKALHILYSPRFDETVHETSSTRRTRALQSRIAGRLYEFYSSATAVIGTGPRGIVPEQYKDLFIFKLGSILATRLKARNIVDDIWLAERPPTLSLEDAYAKLQDELVSLQVLIKNFKAQS